MWLKEKRRSRGVVARVFSGRISLAPAEYAEVEAGIVSWITTKQENLINLMLRFDTDEEAEFNYKLSQAKEASPLSFCDVFSRDQLAPARCCTAGGGQIDAGKREAILNAVFTPLNPRA
jgi:hypothetical protein